MTKAAHEINATYRLAMTGTPLQNRAADLYSLIRFLKIGPYDDWNRFWPEIGRPLKEVEPPLLYDQKVALRKVNGFLDRTMLRRTKKTMINGKCIVSLPEKIELVEPTQFDEQETAFYAELEKEIKLDVDELVARGPGGKKVLGLRLFVHLLRLRQACCHPDLVVASEPNVDEDEDLFDSPEFRDLQSMDGLEPEVRPYAQRGRKKDIKRNKEYYEQLERVYQPSAKIRKVLDLLRSIRKKNPKNKTIIFTCFTSFIDILEVGIRREGCYNSRRFDGTMNSAARDQVVKDFMEGDANILMASIKAGNVGLNLNKATTVIILDPFWNPYVEAQAVDRAYRIGQKRKVTVYRLIVPGSVEDRILKLQEKKRKLVEAAIENRGRIENNDDDDDDDDDDGVGRGKRGKGGAGGTGLSRNEMLSLLGVKLPQKGRRRW